MTSEELKSLVLQDIQATEEYDQYLIDEIKPMINPLGQGNFDRLHFFNVGYKSALEKIRGLLEKESTV
jgi:hypothetical protein